MEQNIFNLNNKIFSNNNNILLEIVNDLHKLMNYSKDNIIIKTLGNIINKMNYMMNENKTNLEKINDDINKLYNKFDELKINNTINNQELKANNGRYIGQVINGMPEGKGIFYYNNGDRSMGDYYNDNPKGKHALLTKDGEIKPMYY